MFYQYQSKNRLKLQYCHIWNWAPETSFYSGSIPKAFVCDYFRQCSNFSRRLSKISDELHSVILQTLSLTTKTRHATYIELNNIYYHCIPLGRRKFRLNSFSPQIANLWNRLPRWCLPDQHKLYLFKSNVNSYSSHRSPETAPLTSKCYWPRNKLLSNRIYRQGGWISSCFMACWIVALKIWPVETYNIVHPII